MRNLRLFFLGCLVYFLSNPGIAAAQISTVNTMQHLSFGAFTTGADGGTITISNEGIRSTTGTVKELGFNTSFANAIFEVFAEFDSPINIAIQDNITLQGSNGGYMSLKIGSSNKTDHFITDVGPDIPTQITIGGMLTVGNMSANPAGIYSGEFQITFYNE